MELKQGIDFRYLAAKLFCLGFFAALLYILFKYAMGAILPFAVAYIVSFLINPIVLATSRITGIPRKLCAAIYVTLVITVLFAAASFGVYRLFSEIEGFISDGNGLNQAVSVVWDMVASASDRLDIAVLVDLSDMGKSLHELVAEIEKNAVNYIASAIPGLLSGVVSRAPSIFIGCFVTIMSCYYFCADGEVISGKIKKAIPQRYRESVESFVALVKTAFKRYIKAYFVLMLITFCEVYIGLLILRVKYALLIAVGVAIVDILPFFGAGTVLVPWAIVCFLAGDVRLGLGLVILYGVITVVRQITEPAVMGSSIGLHPAVSLFSMYMGFKLFGLLGMILGPMAAFILSEILGKGSSEKIKSRT